jgi:hypothetical protein
MPRIARRREAPAIGFALKGEVVRVERGSRADDRIIGWKEWGVTRLREGKKGILRAGWEAREGKGSRRNDARAYWLEGKAPGSQREIPDGIDRIIRIVFRRGKGRLVPERERSVEEGAFQGKVGAIPSGKLRPLGKRDRVVAGIGRKRKENKRDNRLEAE